MQSNARDEEIVSWLRAQLGADYVDHAPASEDASFRRYLRVRTHAGTRVLMDAPPELEDCRPFVHVNALLGDAGLRVPRIDASDVGRGLLLLEDLGDTCMLHRLPAGAPALYEAALAACAALKGPVDAFFEAVMVNADDEALRKNRHALLSELHALMNRVADLAKLAR